MISRTVLDRLAVVMIAAVLATYSVASPTRGQEARPTPWSEFGVSVASVPFGGSVAASEDTIVVGALTNGGGTHRGAAYVFERSDGGWSEVARLVRP